MDVSFFIFSNPNACIVVVVQDLGMRATVFLLEYFASSRTTHDSRGSSSSCCNHIAPIKVVLTAATTGDTGPAAVQAVQDLNSPYLGIVVHYPEDQISDFQRKQMTTVVSDRVEIVSFAGGGDDMDRPIKNIMTKKQQQQSGGSGSNTYGDVDGDDNSDNNILVCGVNSYNIGRPLMQMVHFIWTYLRVVEQIETKSNQKIDHGSFRLDVVIPTGAMGNIAGCVSSVM
jgi:threonine synthase